MGFHFFPTLLGCLIWCTILWLASINMKMFIMNALRAIYHVLNVFRKYKLLTAFILVKKKTKISRNITSRSSNKQPIHSMMNVRQVPVLSACETRTIVRRRTWAGRHLNCPNLDFLSWNNQSSIGSRTHLLGEHWVCVLTSPQRSRQIWPSINGISDRLLTLFEMMAQIVLAISSTLEFLGFGTRRRAGRVENFQRASRLW